MNFKRGDLVFLSPYDTVNVSLPHLRGKIGEVVDVHGQVLRINFPEIDFSITLLADRFVTVETYFDMISTLK